MLSAAQVVVTVAATVAAAIEAAERGAKEVVAMEEEAMAAAREAREAVEVTVAADVEQGLAEMAAVSSRRMSPMCRCWTAMAL